MKLFCYLCVDADKTIVKGKIFSENGDAAVNELKRRGLMPVSVSRRSVLSLDISDIFSFKIPPKKLSVLSGTMYILTDSGVDLQKSLLLLGEQNKKDKPLFDIIRQARIKAGAGCALSEAFGQTARFPEFFISMLEVGEKSGAMPEIFRELSSFYAWEDKCVSDIRSALMYPSIVCVLLMCVAAASAFFILPAFAGIFMSNGVSLPAAARLMLSASSFLADNVFILPLIPVLIIFLIILSLKSPRFKTVVSFLKLNAPFLKRIYILLMNYRFSHSVNILLSSGMTLTNALEPAFKSTDCPYLSRRFYSVLTDIQKGGSFAASIGKIHYFDRLLIGMIETGEETGRLPYVLSVSAVRFKDELERTVKNLNTLVEPVFMILIGIIICGILTAVVLPSFSMIDSI